MAPVREIKGEPAAMGVALGPVWICAPRTIKIDGRAKANPKEERARLGLALKELDHHLEHLYEKTCREVGEEEARIFQIHRMMLTDGDYLQAVETEIATGHTAAWGVKQAGEQFSALFLTMNDSYMSARAADVQDISKQLVELLLSADAGEAPPDHPFILVGSDLTPSQTVQLDRHKVLAFVTESGSTQSHSAILARTMGIPAVVSAAGVLAGAKNGMPAMVDGSRGVCTLEPDETLANRTRQAVEEARLHNQGLEAIKGKADVTADGHPIKLYANIGGVEDMEGVLENDGAGIGLFRSEFLYLRSTDYPDEETQYRAYRAVAEKMDGKPVIIRTLDIGADKQVDYFDLPKEENPAMGMRAIRICLTRPELFRTQLRAIYRASAYGSVAIMFPMIASPDELRRAKAMALSARAELLAEGVAMGEVSLGIMIETPAAAMLSDMLAEEADFFSIGTNDLIQYTLAVDRQNQSLAEFCDPHSPAVLRLISQVVKAGHKAGIWVGICGELAADLTLTKWFLSIGVDELSVSAPTLLRLRKLIRETDVSQEGRTGDGAGIQA